MIGNNIAVARKARGLTQHELVNDAHVSYSLLTKVEAGYLPASPSLVAAVAAALGVDPAALTGQPYAEPMPAGGRTQAAVADLRRALLRQRPAAPEPAGPPDQVLDQDRLGQPLADADRLRTGARYVELAELVPGLLESLLGAAAELRPGDLLFRVWGVLADVYAMAGMVARRLGLDDLATVATDRMGWCADRSGDLLWAAVYVDKRAHLLSAAGETGFALRELATAYARLEAGPAGGTGPEPAALAVAGHLHLMAAIVAGRALLPDRAADELSAAMSYALQLGHGPLPEYYGLPFSAAQVGIHEVGVHVDLGDAAQALRVADGLGVSVAELVPPDQLCHLHIATSRASQMYGKQDQAVHHLQMARQVAPQLAWHDTNARETLDVLLRTTTRPNEGLRDLAKSFSLPSP